MPLAPQRLCPYCGSYGRVRCKCRRDSVKRYDRERGSASARGYGRRWQKARRIWLARYPLCAEHLRQGETAPAEVVDHIVPHKGNMKAFWDQSNWQSLCTTCHNAKTAKEGGFGR